MAAILIVTQFFPPETNAGARRIRAMAEALARKNEVVILAPQPSYPVSTLFDASAVKACDQKFSGQIIRGRAFRPHHPSLIVRALGEIWMAASLACRAVPIDADLVLVSTPSIFLAPFAWLLARFKKAKFVYDLRDLTWCYIRETAAPGRFNGLVSLVLEKFMVAILRRSDLVVCATPGIPEVLSTCHRLSSEKMITIMNGVSDEILAINQRWSPVMDAAQPIVTYVGLFGHNQGVEVLLEAAKQLPAVTFFLIGDGPAKESITRRLSQEKIGNIVIPGYVTSLEQLAMYYQQSAILICHMKNAPVIRSTSMPSKIFEYMAFGKPIIYAGEGLAVDFLRGIGCAVTLPPDDPAMIARAISELLRDEQKMMSMGKRGKDYINQYGRRDKLMLQLGNEFERRFNLN